MNRNFNTSWILGAAALVIMVVILAAAAAAREIAGAGGFDLSWNTVDGGGATFSSGAAFELGGTIGQPDAGQPMTGGLFELSGGFWPGAGGLPVDTCLPDVSGDLLVNVDDLLEVINSWGPCVDCPADIAPPPSFDDVVNVDDLLAVINAWGSCP